MVQDVILLYFVSCVVVVANFVARISICLVWGASQSLQQGTAPATLCMEKQLFNFNNKLITQLALQSARDKIHLISPVCILISKSILIRAVAR